MIVCPGLLFFFSIPFPLHRTTDTPLALRTVCLLSYLLHALPLPLLYYIRVHQYLLMCTICAPFTPVFPHRYLMYHCTFVHAPQPPNMCSTTPLVRVLVV